MKQTRLIFDRDKKLNIYIGISPNFVQTELRSLLPKFITEFHNNGFTNFSLYFSDSFKEDSNLISVFQKEDFEKIFFEGNLSDIEIQIAVTIGGDGAVLWAHKALKSNKDVTYFCFNTGHLGYLTFFVIDDLSHLLTAIAQNAMGSASAKEIMTTEYSRIKTLVYSKDNKPKKELFSLNEIFTNRIKNYCPKLTIEWNGNELVNMNADGLIVCTTLGSTAYNSSVGGPILFQNNNSFVLSAIAPFAINFRSIVFSENDVLTIRIWDKSLEKQCLVVSDSNDELIMELGEKLEISIDKDYRIKFGTFSSHPEKFWIQKIRNIFKWD